MAHMAYKDQPMLPPVNLREGMREHLPMIVAHVTDQVLLLKAKADHKDDVYKLLKQKGFKNEEFTSITQHACDYADYLIYHVGYEENGAYKKAAINAVGLYTARYLKQKGLIDSLPPGVKTYYSNHLTHYPDLAKKITEHESSIKGAKGIKMSYYPTGYQQMPAYPQQQPQQQPQQPIYLDQNGQPFVYNAAGQPMYVQTAQPQVDPQQQHAYSMQRRAMRQQYQATQPTYAVPPAQYPVQQPVYAQAPQTQVAQPFNGQFSGQRQQPPSNVHTYQNQTSNLGPYQNNKYDVLPEPKQTSADPFTGKVVEPAVTAPVVSPEATQDNYNLIRKTDTGFESIYRVGTSWGVNKLGLPLVYDNETRTAVLRLNSNKQPVNILLQRKGGDYVKYDIHENVQFFSATKHNSAPDKNETMRILAEVQRKNFVQEYLEQIEDPKVEGNVTGSLADINTARPVILARTVYGGNGPENILEALRERIIESEHLQDVGSNGQAMNFEYMYVYQLPMFHPPGEIALELRNCETWQDILGVVRRLDRSDVLSQMWCFLNDSIKGYVNRLLRYQFGIGEIKIDSFDADILELIDLLRDEYSISAEFQRFAKRCVQSCAYPYDHTQEAISDGIQPFDVPVVTFGVVYDVTYLPINSDEIYIPVPLDSSIVDEGNPRAYANECIVTRQSFPELYDLISSRWDETTMRTTFVMLLLMDGRYLYCHRTGAQEAFIISKTV